MVIVNSILLGPCSGVPEQHNGRTIKVIHFVQCSVDSVNWTIPVLECIHSLADWWLAETSSHADQSRCESWSVKCSSGLVTGCVSDVKGLTS